MRTRGHVIRDPTTTDLARLRRIGKRGVGIFFPVAAPRKKHTRCNAHSQQHNSRSETILRVPDHVAGYQWNGGFPGFCCTTNGAHVWSQLPPFCPHSFAFLSFCQSVGSVIRERTSVLRKLSTFAVTAPAGPALLASPLPMPQQYLFPL